jgi:hypothetical protein
MIKHPNLGYGLHSRHKFWVETKNDFLIFAKSLIIYIFRDISDAKALSVSINFHILYKKEIVIPSLDIYPSVFWDTNQRLFRTMGVRKNIMVF